MLQWPVSMSTTILRSGLPSERWELVLFLETRDWDERCYNSLLVAKQSQQSQRKHQSNFNFSVNDRRELFLFLEVTGPMALDTLEPVSISHFLSVYSLRDFFETAGSIAKRVYPVFKKRKQQSSINFSFYDVRKLPKLGLEAIICSPFTVIHFYHL